MVVASVASMVVPKVRDLVTVLVVLWVDQRVE